MGVFGKFQARMRGEVSDEPLRAYRRAGAAVDALMADVDQRRVDATLAGRSGWTLDRSAQVEALCAWCAFVLQQLGDATLDAHEARRQRRKQSRAKASQTGRFAPGATELGSCLTDATREDRARRNVRVLCRYVADRTEDATIIAAC